MSNFNPKNFLEKTICRLFEEQAAKIPDNIALVGNHLTLSNYRKGDKESPTELIHLTYKEVNQQKDRIAGMLQQEGAEPGSLVAVILERSIEMVISVLGILKAGCAYLPIDPKYPEERIKLILADSDAKFIISDSSGYWDRNFITSVSSLPETPHSLAYVLYTSGSTGIPKGVLIEQISVVNLLFSLYMAYPLETGDSYLLKTSFVFDVSVTELLGWFIGGGKLVILEKGGEKDASAILNTISTHCITHINFAPAMFNIFIDWLKTLDIKRLRNLKYIFLAGEVLLPEIVNRFREFDTKIKLENLYGPTEGTVYATRYSLSQWKGIDSIPIGRPLPNLDILILTPHDKPVSGDEQGELCLSGLGVARGYLNNPELTAEKFIRRKRILDIKKRNSFIDLETTQRLKIKKGVKKSILNSFDIVYKTGDMAKRQEDGNINFLGRIDTQVKIRGVRIELEEIESVLLSYRKIKEAVVMAQVRKDDDKYLCAYIVPNRVNKGATISIKALRDYLSRKLPKYMIPVNFVILEQLPLSISGKVDRKALPAPKFQRIGDVIPPRNKLEERLIAIWAKALGIERGTISIEDNFVDIGGHSLLGALIVFEIHKAFNVALTLSELFELGTIDKLATYIDNAGKKLFLPLNKATNKNYYQLSPAQSRMFVVHHLNPYSTVYNLVSCYELEGKLEIPKINEVFRQLISRHESLRTCFIMKQGEPVQQIKNQVDVEIDELLINNSEQIKCLVHGYSGGEPSDLSDLHSEPELNIFPREANAIYHKCQKHASRSDLKERKRKKISSIKINDFLRPFDLANAPLLHVGIGRIDDKNYILLLDLHHIIADGHSLTLLIDDFLKMYRGKVLSPVKFQYKDYSQWKLQRISGGELGNQEAYWLKEFSGEIPILLLPFDYPRPVKQSYIGADIIATIHENEYSGLKELALSEDVTLFMLLLSAYGILLSKLTGQEDVVIGIPMVGRKHPELNSIIGMFVNMAAIRSYPYGNKKINEFLKEIKRKVLEAFENQEFPFEELVDSVAPERNSDLNPLFGCVFTYETHTTHQDKKTGLKINHIDTCTGTSKFDITLSVKRYENEGVWALIMEYSTELFKAETIERFMGYFNRILFQMKDNPCKLISELELLTEEEKKVLLIDFNRSFEFANKVLNNQSDKTLCDFFCEEAEKSPDQVALAGRSLIHGTSKEINTISSVFMMNYISYKELKKNSQNLAQFLKQKGIQADTIVGVMMERSIEMAISVLSILEAGGAYLPIAPDYPEERKKLMKKDCGIQMLISDEKHQDKEKFLEPLSEIIHPLHYQIGKHKARKSKKTLWKRQGSSSENSLAYIIYTSGSTGRPKGVMVTHRNVIRLVKNTNYIEFKTGDRLLQTGALEFDASTFEIWGMLLNGLNLYLMPKEQLINSAILKKIINKNCITMMWMTAPWFNQVAQDNSDVFSGLRCLLVGGDVLSPTHIDKVRSKFSQLKIINGYGPTENTTFSTTFLIDREYRDNIPIGKPINGSTAYIVDKNDVLQPIGILGELLVGGRGIARGYLNNPELTSVKFVQLKFSLNMSTFSLLKSRYFQSAIYRTGDLACWQPDGNIRFLGRKDQQVKIRGYRIELGEIENRLTKHERIKEAVVIQREDSTGDKYLCAYLTTRSKEKESGQCEIPQDSQLREYLLKTLPDYMIPAHFIGMQQIPLTQNGKVDQKALPVPGISLDREVYAPPENDIQKKLLTIWSSVLSVDQKKIGIDDNFFRLGGHSLKGTVIIARIHQQLNIRISLAEIFKNPTIRRLSLHLNKTVEDRFFSIPAVEKREYYVLSSAQKRLFVLNQLEVDSIQYNIPEFFLLEKIPDIERLESSIQEIISRHESFRTSFHLVNDEPVQRIHADVAFEIIHHELPNKGTTPEPLGTQSLKEMINKFIRPFDLRYAPLLRVIFISYAEGPFIFMADMHHIISDGVSLEIFNQELQILYNEIRLPALKIQYKDYTQWQQQKDFKEKVRSQENYWLESFAGELPVLDLPLDFARPKIHSFVGDTISFQLEKEITTGLNQFAENHNSTLFMVLFTVFTILLKKLSGQEDIIVGTPVAGRRHAQLENIIGMFVNTLTFRSKPVGEKSCRDFLAENKSTILNTFENQEYPFEELVNHLLPDRDTGRNPLFDVMFSFQNMKKKKVQPESLEFKPYEYRNVSAKFDLTLIISEKDDDLRLSWEFCTAIFNEQTVRRFNSYFKQIARSILENPAITLGEVNIINEDEKTRLLKDFNKTAEDYPWDKTLYELFREQMETTPDKIALVGEDQTGDIHSRKKKTPGLLNLSSLSYRKLDEQSRRLAQLLMENGTGSKEIVAVMMERSIEMVIGIFGILLSGGAYLPVNIENPQERVDYILKDSGTKILLTDRKDSGTDLNSLNVLEFIQINKIKLIKGKPGKRKNEILKTPDTPISINPAAYIIYTSGTTGKPKGVMVEHRSVVNLLFSLSETYSVSSVETYLLKTSFSFDVSVTELFGWYMRGGCLSILEQGGEKEPSTLLENISRHLVTHINFVPSMFHAFLEYLDKRNINAIESLKYIFLAGEVLTPEAVVRFRKLGSSISLENLYGPTEATVYASGYSLSKWSDKSYSSVPIGKPLTNVILIIVDKHERPAAIGQPGELCIGGVGVARGYLNNPELSAEKFIRQEVYTNLSGFNHKMNPSSPGAYSPSTYTLYRSGDMARWKEDGNILYLGRIDHQVKIRGYRIELGEIENRMLKHECIKEAVVTVLQDRTGDKYLSAYFTTRRELKGTKQNKNLSGTVLREYLARTLPDYMIPLYFLQIQEIPLTLNGKVDRKALPRPEIEDGQAVFAPPENEVQKQLLEIWSSVLAIDKEKIGLDDNFFRLGGHSLKGTLIIAKIHRKFNIRISLGEIFKNPTVRRLSGHLEKAVEEQFISIELSEQKEYYPLSSTQKQLYIVNQVEPDSTQYNMPEIYYLEKEPDMKRLETAFKQMIMRHESFRTSFQMVENEPVQRINTNAVFNLLYTNTTLKQEENVPKSTPRAINNIDNNIDNNVDDILKSFIRPFDLSSAPLLRAGIAKIGMEDFIFMVDRHHIISDGVSLEIFKQELQTLYDKKQLPVLSIQYKDYAHWQQKQANRKRLKEQEKYWQKEFAGELPVLNLLTDFTRPVMQSYAGNSISFTLGEDITLGLKQLSEELNSTLFMILLAGFYILLMKLSGQEDITVGTPAVGRRHAQLQGIIGMFVNTLALRNIPSGVKSCSGFLTELKNRTLEAFENQEYPFEELVNHVVLNRDIGRNPIFDVMFILRNRETGDISPHSLFYSHYEYKNVTAKFDLTLSVDEKTDSLQLTWEYCTDLFKEQTIRRFNSYFEQVLHSMSETPNAKIKEISVIPDEERFRILVEFNETARDFPVNKPLHKLFHEMVEREPDHIALVGKQHEWEGPEKEIGKSLISDKILLSYSQLSVKVSILAMALARKGVMPDNIIGIKLKRSIELIVGILGILESGAAYLPIDPDYPLERIDYMLKDSGATVMIEREMFSSLKAEVNLPHSTRAGNTLENASTNMLAYIIYTSGSTGKPKGVMVNHAPIVNTLWALSEMYPMGNKDIYLLKTSFLFDVSLTELFGWFVGKEGSQLEVLEPGVEKDPRRLMNTMEKVHITSINFVPSMFNIFLESLDKINISKISTLKYIFLAGEILPREAVINFRRLNSSIQLENLYGPTEAAVYTSRFSLSQWDNSDEIPIGNPLANINLFILDFYGGIQPLGVAGELAISGIGLARGYMNRPELTFEKFDYFSRILDDLDKENTSTTFIPVPTTVHHSSGKDTLFPNFFNNRRLYRTGDLACWQPDGNIRFLGRLDQQVKIRGFRIETGEIENQLSKHESIKQSFVMAVKKSSVEDTYLCAYFVADRVLPLIHFREFLSKKLPDYMIPAIFIQIDEIPLNSSGKIDMKHLPEPKFQRSQLGQNYEAPVTELEKQIGQIWTEILHLDMPGIHDRFFDLGGNSMKYIQVNDRLQKLLQKDIPMVLLYRYPTIHSLARYLQGNDRTETIPGKERSIVSKRSNTSIAVIGMAGRFPGAQNIGEFWENLKNGVESISFFSESELREAGVSTEFLEDSNYVKARGILENTAFFDASFFNYTPREANLLDPQLRVYHECCWSALEDAGYNPSTYRGAIGVFSGAGSDALWMAGILSEAGTLSGHYDAVMLNINSSFGTRISYQFNLRGPSYSVQTACSTSLVTIHLACRALIDNECEMALAGGVSINNPSKTGYLYQEGMILSPDGHNRTFDAKAKGTVPGEGVGVVVLKSLENAITDKDHIYALVNGTAINNDGTRKVGYTAPSVEGQAEVIKEAMNIAGIEPGMISYIESHGTATVMGDPIEIQGLKLAFESAATPPTDEKPLCSIGSVKSNIGHLDMAAGVAGFIKVALSLKHKLIPPSLHYQKSNPAIGIENSFFEVNKKLKVWKSDGKPLRAGVSSFGIGGTNAHAVLEEWKNSGSTDTKHKASEALSLPGNDPLNSHLLPWVPRLLLFSARTQSGVETQAQNLVSYFKNNPYTSLADAAYTLQVGRKEFKNRAISICASLDEAIENLAPSANGKLQVKAIREENPPVVFMFPGQGAQYENMGLDLYRNNPFFRREMDRGFEILAPLMGYDVREILYPSLPSKKSNMSPLFKDKKEYKIDQTEIAQPLIFLFEYALAKLLIHWGIGPSAMIGHSIGEYTAACLAGVFSQEDALTLVALRGQLMQKMPFGKMLGVPVPENEILPLLNRELSLAAVNTHTGCVISGNKKAVQTFAKTLKEKGYESRELHTSHAFHSPMMDPILERYKEKVKLIPLNNPAIPYLSNVTGQWITEEEATDPSYWSTHLRQTVRFYAGMTELLKKENKAILVEVGPGRTLSTFARQHPDKSTNRPIFNLVRHPKEKERDDRFLLNKIGNLWLHGKHIDWHAFYSNENRYRVSLPTYPFERQSYRVQTNVIPANRSGEISSEMPLKKKPRIEDWFYVPSWKRDSLPIDAEDLGSVENQWLIFIPADGNYPLLTQLVEEMQSFELELIFVNPGLEFDKKEDGNFTLDPGNEADYISLLEKLLETKRLPQRILHLWGYTHVNPKASASETERILDLTLYSLLGIARAIGKLNIKKEIQIDIITSDMQEVTGDENLCPAKAAILGPAKSIPLEYPNIRCRSIDISGNGRYLLKNLRMELSRENKTGISIVALRGSHRWQQEFEPVSLGKLPGFAPSLKEKGVYMVTGGLGGMGLELAEYLAKTIKAKLVLIDLIDFPSSIEWEQWLNTHSEEDENAKKIRRLKKLEELGAEVLVQNADVVNQEQMKRVLETIEKKWGKVNGVIHTAGRPGGRLIHLGTRDFSERVINPKIKGTLVLDTLLQSHNPEFMVLCSSISSVIGGFGQAEYIAANSFLDTYANYKNLSGGVRTTSINWDAWQEVGMAVGEPGKEIYTTRLNPKTHWELGEHRVKGVPTLVGTAYLELLIAAFKHHAHDREIEIGNLHYLSPITADREEDINVQIILEKEENQWEFSVCSNGKSLSSSTDEPLRQVHARGTIASVTGAVSQIRDLTEICDDCREISTGLDDLQTSAQSHLVEVGPRWDNLKEIKLGMHRGIARLELPSSFSVDTKVKSLHPALLDIATSFLIPYISQECAYLPFSFKKIQIKKSLPSKIYSYARTKPDWKPQQQTLELDITVMDEKGETVMEIEGFLLVAVSNDKSRESSFQKVFPEENKPAVEKDNVPGGILPSEGVEVFSRVISHNIHHVLVSTVDLPRRLEKEIHRNTIGEAELKQKENIFESLHPRPEISTPYAPPRTKTQAALAEIWQDYLGIGEIGINDDFFELGADSLKALTVIAKIHKEFHVEITISDIFTYPSINQLSDYIERAQESIYSSITLLEEKEYYPLSSAQKRLYYLQQMHEDSVFYNLLFPFIIKGQLDSDLLYEAFDSLIERHESLRTSFPMVGEEPVQRIHSGVKFEVHRDDLGLEESIQTPVSTEILTNEIENFSRPFDLSQPPLLRMAVWQIREEEYLWVLEIHHIITDATGYGVIQKELEKLYNKETLLPVKVRYKDFAYWQNNLIASGKIKKQFDYWLNIFSDGVPGLNFPTDYERPEVMTYKGGWHHFQLPAAETSEFLKLASTQGATLFVALLAVLNIIAFKYTGQEDIVIGSSTAGRPHTDIQKVVGMFVNMLPIRNFPAKNLTFMQLLNQVKTSALTALENQDVQLEILVEQLGIEAGTSGNTLFNICLNVENYEIPMFNFNDLEFTTFPYDTNTAKFDILLWANRIEDKLYFMLEYSTELFKPSTAEDFSNHLIEIIRQVIENKEISLQDIEISNQLSIPEPESPEIDFNF